MLTLSFIYPPVRLRILALDVLQLLRRVDPVRLRVLIGLMAVPLAHEDDITVLGDGETRQVDERRLREAVSKKSNEQVVYNERLSSRKFDS